MQPLKEKAIILEFKKGSEKAFKELFDTYYINLVIYCFNLTGNESQAKDIVQETLIKIWDRRKSLEINTSLKSYLYRSVYNNFVKEYTKKVRTEKVLLDFKRDTLNRFTDLDEAEHEKKLKLIEDAIEQLPKKCRKVFLMNKMDGYRYKEIASELSITEKAVEKHISRAIARIRESLDIKKSLILIYCFIKKRFSFEE